MNMRPHIIFRKLVLLCIAGLCATSVQAFEMGPLTQFLQEEDDGRWVLRDDRGAALLENRHSPGDISYYYVDPEPGAAGQREIRLTVSLIETNGPNSGAGIAYGVDQQRGTFFLFTLTANGVVRFHFMDNGDYQEQFSVQPGDLNTDRVELMIRESGNEISLYVNGSEVSTFGNNLLGRGAAGIVSVDQGKYRLANFNVTSGNRGSEQPSAPIATQPQRPAQPGNVVYQERIDPQVGMVKFRVPLPRDWKLHEGNQNNPAITGPNVEVYESDMGPFHDTSDAFARGTLHQAGQQITPLISVEEYLRQQYAPYLEGQGYTLTQSYPLPGVTRYYELFSAGMPNTGTHRRYFSLGTEWQHANGSRMFTVLIQRVFQQNNLVNWGVTVGELFTDSRNFDHAKQAYRQGIAQTEINPQYQIYKNEQLIAQLRRDRQKWDERTRQSAIAHGERMNAILARGASSNSIAKINSDILDISHQGYLQRDNMVSAGQANQVMAIAGQSVIHNPQTGEHYQVDSTKPYHWVGPGGEWFGTENANYDPRRDPALNSLDWSSFEVVR